MLTISNKEMNHKMKIVQALKNFGHLLKGVTRTIKSETKEQKSGFLRVLFGALGANLSVNMLAGKGTVRARHGKKRQGIVKTGSDSKNF